MKLVCPICASCDRDALGLQVDRAQRIVEGQNFDIRHTLWRYSNFVEGQRRLIYQSRRQVLEGTVSAGIFQERRPAVHQNLQGFLGDELLLDLERRLMLQAIDDCWSRHLATVTEIRDGIHLAEVGGLDPFREFLKSAAESFKQTLEAIDEQAIDRFDSLELTPDGLEFEKMGLHGPSSTWTYLVNDEAFTDRLTASLIGGRNVGFAAGAAMTGPLLLLWALSRRFGRWRNPDR